MEPEEISCPECGDKNWKKGIKSMLLDMKTYAYFIMIYQLILPKHDVNTTMELKPVCVQAIVCKNCDYVKFYNCSELDEINDIFKKLAKQFHIENPIRFKKTDKK